MEIVEMIVYCVLGGISGFLGALGAIWVSKRIMLSPDSVAETSDSVMEYLIKTKEGQEKIYGMGYLLGKAFMDGTGFRGKAGKGGIMGAVEEGIGQFIKGLIPGGKGQENPQQSSKMPWDRE